MKKRERSGSAWLWLSPIEWTEEFTRSGEDLEPEMEHSHQLPGKMVIKLSSEIGITSVESYLAIFVRNLNPYNL